MPSNTALIAKNTLILYFRQLLLILASLYTVRIKLEILGIEDFGIYNIVSGFAIVFSFLDSTMTTSTQRFLNYSMGQNNKEELHKIFNISLIIHFSVALIILILAETIGLWFFYNHLNIPPERYFAALIVYQLSILSTVITILRVPYRAIVISYEKMSFFALMSIIEVLSRLGIIFLLPLILYDKLIIYALLILFSDISIFIFHKVYCSKNFDITRFNFYKDKVLFLKIANFSGWSLLGHIANTCCTNGRDIILNMFHGVTLNAAMGIASQVNSTINTFVANFQTAFRPQLIKSYAAKNDEYFERLIFQTSKLSFFLLFFIALPLIINADFVIQIWLKNVPEYSIGFTRLMLLYSLQTSISGPLIISIQATGNIKKYELISSLLLLLNLPLSILFLFLGFAPHFLIIIRIIISIFVVIWQLIYLVKNIKFPIIKYLYNVITPIIIIFIISGIISFTFSNIFIGWTGLIFNCFISSISIITLVYFIGLNNQERKVIISFILSKTKNFRYLFKQ